MSDLFVKILRSAARGLGLVLIFVGGTMFGVYYHAEIAVVLGGIVNTYFSSTQESVQVLPSPDLSRDAVVILPNTEDLLPLIYSETLDEAKIQEYLKRGAVVLPLGKSFGEPGNVVVTAHSSGTESFGPYRFAFAKLSELEEGQEYEIQTPAATYRYRVYGKEIVWPHEVDKLPHDERSTVTLVTCWPLWTNFQRLLVHTELVSVEYRI